MEDKQKHTFIRLFGGKSNTFIRLDDQTIIRENERERETKQIEN